MSIDMKESGSDRSHTEMRTLFKTKSEKNTSYSEQG